MPKRTYRQVFEHHKLTTTDPDASARISTEELRRLEDYHGQKGTPFFTLIKDGVRFNEYVGVLQAGPLTVEVLPKADNGAEEKGSWQKFLLSMLRTTGLLPSVTGTSALQLRRTSILDVYMELFLREVKTLIQQGLIRRYRTTERNSTALKGALQFGQNIRRNFTHAERFYVRYSVYDRDHVHHAILLQTIRLIHRISSLPSIASEASALELSFPECGTVTPSQALFDRLPTSRKTEAYGPAISIARLLLLSLHPDISQGQSEVLALMFDMNILWEKYVARMLRRALPNNLRLEEQVRNPFWRYGQRAVRSVRPDMVIYPRDSNKAIIVLDTKWKCPYQGVPDDADLKQMLVYNLYNMCEHSILVYPLARSARPILGRFDLKGHGCCETAFLRLSANKRTGMVLDIESLVKKIRNIDAATSR